MVAVLIAIALYLVFGSATLVLVLKGPEKHESYIEATYLAAVIILWPAVAVWHAAARLEGPHFKNPFWTGREK